MNTQTKYFRAYTVADYIAGKPAVYRNGETPAEVTILHWKTKPVCLCSINISDAVIMHSFTEGNNWDLVIECKKREYWVNLFRTCTNVVMGSGVVHSREHALNIRNEKLSTIIYIGDPVKLGEEYI